LQPEGHTQVQKTDKYRVDTNFETIMINI